MCFLSLVDDNASGLFAPQLRAICRITSDPLKWLRACGLPKKNIFSSDTSHLRWVLTSNSNDACMSGVRRMGTFRHRLPFISILWKFLQSFRSRSDKASSTSGWAGEVSLKVKALRGILDTSPSLLWLKRIISQSVTFARSPVFPTWVFFELSLVLLSLDRRYWCILFTSSVKGRSCGTFHFASLRFLRAWEDTHSLHLVSQICLNTCAVWMTFSSPEILPSHSIVLAIFLRLWPNFSAKDGVLMCLFPHLGKPHS